MQSDSDTPCQLKAPMSSCERKDTGASCYRNEAIRPIYDTRDTHDRTAKVKNVTEKRTMRKTYAEEQAYPSFRQDYELNEDPLSERKRWSRALAADAHRFKMTDRASGS